MHADDEIGKVQRASILSIRQLPGGSALVWSSCAPNLGQLVVRKLALQKDIAGLFASNEPIRWAAAYEDPSELRAIRGA